MVSDTCRSRRDLAHKYLDLSNRCVKKKGPGNAMCEGFKQRTHHVLAAAEQACNVLRNQQRPAIYRAPSVPTRIPGRIYPAPSAGWLSRFRRAESGHKLKRKPQKKKRCSAKTLRGSRCRNMVGSNGGVYCRCHGQK